MKKLLIPLIVLLMILPEWVHAQKKFALVEHYSNTPCPNCQGSRPNIYSTLDKYKGEVNHLTIHRKLPYPDCELYLYNTKDADERENVYKQSTMPITGSPLLSVNGTLKHHSNFESNIKDAEKDAVLIGLNMKEEGSNVKKVTLDVSNLTGSSVANLYVYVAVVEREVDVRIKSVDYEVHDVFRKFLGSNGGNGDAVGTLSGGTSKQMIIEGLIPNDLDLSDLYIVAWVEERKPQGDKFQIIIQNSVSVNTNTITSTKPTVEAAQLTIFPNPAQDVLNVRNESDFIPEQLRILDALGKEIKRGSSLDRIRISDLSTGQYFLILENRSQQAVRKFIKQ